MSKDTTTWGLVRDARAPLVGREAEMAVLDEAVGAVIGSGEARIVSLVGPTGIGKSRLIQDFVIRHRGPVGGGAYAIDVLASGWLCLCTFRLSPLVGFG